MQPVDRFKCWKKARHTRLFKNEAMKTYAKAWYSGSPWKEAQEENQLKESCIFHNLVLYILNILNLAWKVSFSWAGRFWAIPGQTKLFFLLPVKLMIIILLSFILALCKTDLVILEWIYSRIVLKGVILYTVNGENWVRKHEAVSRLWKMACWCHGPNGCWVT